MRAVLDLRRKDHVRLRAMLRRVLGVGLPRVRFAGFSFRISAKIDGSWTVTPRTAKQRRGNHNIVPADPTMSKRLPVTSVRSTAIGRPNIKLFWTAGTRYPFRRSPMSHKYIEYHITKLREQAGVRRRLTSHSFRHGVATRLLRSGADLETVRTILGHASVNAVQHYLHTDTERCRDAMVAIQ
ncbi:MAG: tyrosine-type recombinase/integrase [Myxococcota bacterium]